MRKRRLAVEDVRAGLLEELLRATAPLDPDHRVVGPVADRDRRQGPLEVELEALDGRNEPAQRDDSRGAGAVGPETERVAHHRALGEPAEDRALRRHAGLRCELVQQSSDHPVGGQERVGRRVPQLAQHVPVRASGRKRERPARASPRAGAASGSSASSSGKRSFSSVPRPWKRTSAPSGSPVAGLVL